MKGSPVQELAKCARCGRRFNPALAGAASIGEVCPLCCVRWQSGDRGSSSAEAVLAAVAGAVVLAVALGMVAAVARPDGKRPAAGLDERGRPAAAATKPAIGPKELEKLLAGAEKVMFHGEELPGLKVTATGETLIVFARPPYGAAARPARPASPKPSAGGAGPSPTEASAGRRPDVELLESVAADAAAVRALAASASAFAPAAGGGEKAPSGSADADRRCVVLLPRKGLTLSRRRGSRACFSPGAVTSLAGVVERFGAPSVREAWLSGWQADFGLSSPVYWWGDVGLAAAGDRTITHVLLYGVEPEPVAAAEAGKVAAAAAPRPKTRAEILRELEEELESARATSLRGSEFRGLRLGGSGERLILFTGPKRAAAAPVTAAGSGAARREGRVAEEDADRELLKSVSADAERIAGLCGAAGPFVEMSSGDVRLGGPEGYVLVLPRKDLPGNRLPRDIACFSPGGVTSLEGVVERFGAPSEKESWPATEKVRLGLKSSVYWWGKVGLAAAGDKAITHVLLSGP